MELIFFSFHEKGNISVNVGKLLGRHSIVEGHFEKFLHGILSYILRAQTEKYTIIF